MRPAVTHEVTGCLRCGGERHGTSDWCVACIRWGRKVASRAARRRPPLVRYRRAG